MRVFCSPNTLLCGRKGRGWCVSMCQGVVCAVVYVWKQCECVSASTLGCRRSAEWAAMNRTSGAWSHLRAHTHTQHSPHVLKFVCFRFGKFCSQFRSCRTSESPCEQHNTHRAHSDSGAVIIPGLGSETALGFVKSKLTGGGAYDELLSSKQRAWVGILRVVCTGVPRPLQGTH